MKKTYIKLTAAELETVSGGADGCGKFVEMTGPNGQKSYYDPVGVIHLSTPQKGEAAPGAQSTMRTQVGTFYSNEPVGAMKDKISAACGQ